MERFAIDSLYPLPEVLKAEMRGKKMPSTFKSICGSFCPEGGSVIKQGRVLDGGCLVQNAMGFFHIGLPSDRSGGFMLSYSRYYHATLCKIHCGWSFPVPLISKMLI